MSTVPKGQGSTEMVFRNYSGTTVSLCLPEHDKLLAYPSSTVQAIWAPAIDILRVIRSLVDSVRFPGFAASWLPFRGVERNSRLPLKLVWGRLTPLACLEGQAIWVVGSGSLSEAGGIMGYGGRWVAKRHEVRFCRCQLPASLMRCNTPNSASADLGTGLGRF